MTLRKMACTVMALVMILCTIGTVALAAESVENSKEVGTYADFHAAYSDSTVTKIVLTDNIPLTAKYYIAREITIDGQGMYGFVANNASWSKSGSLYHLVGVTGDNVTIKDLTFDNNMQAYGVNVYQAQNVVFDNVTIINHNTGKWNAALTVNGSTLKIVNGAKITSGNMAIDVSNGSGVTSPLGLMASGVLDIGERVMIASAAMPNTDFEGALRTDGTPYYAAVHLNANGVPTKFYKAADIKNSSTGIGSNGFTSGTFKLYGDYTLRNNLVLVKEDGDVTLDLNFNTLTIPEEYTFDYNGNLKVINYGAIIGKAEFVAAINDTAAYSDLSEAMEAAEDGDTITLLRDVEADTEMKTVANVIFDLNGKTITGKDNVASGNFTLISVKDDTHLTVTDSIGGGKITLEAENNRAWGGMSNIFENRGSELTIEDGTFEHLGGTDMAFVVNVNANSFGDATLNVEGGELSSTYIAARLFMDSKSSNAGSGTAIVNVSGGAMEGISRAIWAQAPNSVDGQKGTINVSGGTVGTIDTARSTASVVNTTISGGMVGNIKAEKGELKITDGTITGTLTILDADGNAVAEDEIISGGNFAFDPSGYEAEGFDTFNTGASDTPFMVEEKVAENITVVFEGVTGKPGLYDIKLESKEYDIYEFVSAELTFKNASKTNGGADMQYTVSGISGVTSAEENFGIENDADERTFNFRLVNHADVSARLTGKTITIGQIQFIGESDNGLNLTVTGEKVAATKRGTHDEDWYTMTDDGVDNDTLLAGDGIVGGAAVEAKRDVEVNVSYIHDLNPGYWQNNDLTVTLKDAFGKEYDAQDISDGTATFANVPLGRITVTLKGAGFRLFPYTTVMEKADSPLVLSFWNDVKREKAEAIEDGKEKVYKNFLVGDIVMDYTVDEYDLAAVTSYYGMYALTDADKYLKYDLNRDGNIDIIDVAYVLHTLNN